MKNTRVQKMVAVAMFAAIALVLQYFAFPIMPAFSFLKIDFSDIPVLISMFLFGPAAGVATAFLRSVLHLLTTGFSPDNLVGDTASFLSTTIFTFPIYYFFSVKKQHKGRNKFLGVITGTIALMLFYQKEYQNKNNNTHFVKLLFKKFVFPYSLLFFQVFKAFFFFIVAFPFFYKQTFSSFKRRRISHLQRID